MVVSPVKDDAGVAASAAMAAARRYRVDGEYYRPIPEWIAGFGYLAAHTA